MAIITVTAQVNEKNTRTVSTANGDKKIISVPLFEKEKGSNVKLLTVQLSCLTSFN